MNRSLTIAYVTARRDPAFQWFFDSLIRQARTYFRGSFHDKLKVIVVDMFAGTRDLANVNVYGIDVRHVPPKPTVWQGPHRLTKEDWWAVSAYRNTAVCLCDTDWIAMLDDRCVLMPTFLRSIGRAMDGKYAVCGRYQKRYNMAVTDGAITGHGEICGEDPRWKALRQRTQIRGTAHQAPGTWFYGACNAQPLEWALQINGWDESCDSLGLEDCVYGQMLDRNHFALRYDPEMFMIEDRSVAAVEPPTCKRADKGVSPNDKSHAILDRTNGKKRATHGVDLRAIRELVLRRGEPFPIPSGPTHDWYDGQPLAEF